MNQQNMNSSETCAGISSPMRCELIPKKHRFSLIRSSRLDSLYFKIIESKQILLVSFVTHVFRDMETLSYVVLLVHELTLKP